MKPDAPLQTLADAYRQLLDSIENSSDDLTAAEGHVPQQAPFAELEIQSLWATGIFSNEGETVRHGHLRILDFGEWNRGPGPDFQYAEVEIDGKIMRGDIEIDPRAQDWENHGHGANPNFNNVVLHVVLSAPPRGWFTRNSLHMEIPVYYLDSESIRASLGIERTRAVTHLKTPLCRTPLSEMEPARIEQMLKSAAAFRLSLKRKRFKRQIVAFGEKQAWYEAWADTLGFSANHRTQSSPAPSRQKRRGHPAGRSRLPHTCPPLPIVRRSSGIPPEGVGRLVENQRFLQPERPESPCLELRRDSSSQSPPAPRGSSCHARLTLE